MTIPPSRSHVLVLGLALVLVLMPGVAACGDGDPAVPDAAVKRAFTIQTSGGVDVDASGNGDLAVQVVPGDGFSDAVTFTVLSPPGVTADALTLAAGTTAGVLKVHAASGTRIDTTMRVVAESSAGLSQNASVFVTAGVTSGVLDLTFGDEGVATGAFGCQHMAVAPDGSMFVPLYHGPSGQTIIHLTTAGQPDPSYGTQGVATSPMFPTYVFSSALDADGALILSGTDTSGGGSIYRVRTDGSLDPGFGNGGVLQLLPPGSQAAVDLAGVHDGKIYVAGVASARRYGADGQLDTGYGTAGELTWSPPPGFSTSPLLLDDGSWLLLGATGTGAAVVGAAVRVDSSGTVGTPRASPLADTRWYDAVADRSGGFYLLEARGPTSNEGDPASTSLVHIIGPDLAYDAAFGHGGRADALPPGIDLRVLIVGVEQDGKAIMTGASTHAIGTHLYRYGLDGRLDPTFRIDGTALMEDISHGHAGRFDDFCGAAIDGLDRIDWSGTVRILL